MDGRVLVAGSIVYFVAAYFLYGKFLTRHFGIDPSRKTPANELKDGVDYVPAKAPVLFGHHFASIAGAGPILGPVLAAYFGWLPAVIWILVGCVFIGAFHDFAALFLSVRDKGRSIGHVIEGLMGYAGRQVFLVFCWSALVLVVAIFALAVSKTFVATPAVATASLLFIAMAPVFGWLVYRKNLSILHGSLIFVPLLFAFVWVGTQIPLDLSARFQKASQNADIKVNDAAIGAGFAAVTKTLESMDEVAAIRKTEEGTLAYDEACGEAKQGLIAATEGQSKMPRALLADAGKSAAQSLLAVLGKDDDDMVGELSHVYTTAVVKVGADAKARAVWIWILMVYVFIASVVPVWMLLQPRDYLNSYLLYAMMIVGFLGVLLAAPELKMPAFAGMTAPNHKGSLGSLFPLLFVTIACGACSGFHSLVASGTTAKQLANEKHILPVGYGGMLVEGVLAVMALVSVCYLVPDEYNTTVSGGAVGAFASGLANFAEDGIRLPLDIGKTFISLAISAFMLTTLDTATRLARFTWQELFLPKSSGETETDAAREHVLASPIVATVVSVLAAVALVFSGGGMAIWPVFGASNQLLAALTLLALTLYLLRAKKNFWLALVPMLFMMVITIWALVLLIQANIGKNITLAVTSAFLLVMALVLVVLAAKSVSRARNAS